MHVALILVASVKAVLFHLSAGRSSGKDKFTLLVLVIRKSHFDLLI